MMQSRIANKQDGLPYFDFFLILGNRVVPSESLTNKEFSFTGNEENYEDAWYFSKNPNTFDSFCALKVIDTTKVEHQRAGRQIFEGAHKGHQKTKKDQAQKKTQSSRAPFLFQFLPVTHASIHINSQDNQTMYPSHP